MGKQKRPRVFTSITPQLCGCNPAIVTQVVVLVGKNQAALDHALDRLDGVANVAVMAMVGVEEDAHQLFKGCIGQIAHLSKTLREMADAVDDPPEVTTHG